MRSFSLSFSVSSSLSSRWRGSSSKKKKTFKKKKTNRCRQTSRNFTVASLKKNDENDDDDRTITTPFGMVVVKEEAKEKSIEYSRVDFAMPNRLLSSENLTTVRVVSLQKRVVSRILNFFLEGCLSSFLSKLTKTPLKQQQTG